MLACRSHLLSDHSARLPILILGAQDTVVRDRAWDHSTGAGWAVGGGVGRRSAAALGFAGVCSGLLFLPNPRSAAPSRCGSVYLEENILDLVNWKFELVILKV